MTAPVGPDEPSARPGLWPLAALCAGVNLLEALLLLAHDPSALSLSAQASAVGPLGVFHDLRWLSVYTTSWWTGSLEVAATIALRGAFMAVATHWAWGGPGPGAGPPRPPWPHLWIRGAAATAAFSVLLAPSVVTLFASAVVPVSWLFIAGVPFALMVSVVVHPAAVCRGWWRRTVPPRAIGWVLVAFLSATAAGVVVSALPTGAAPAVAVVAGVGNAWIWRGLVGAFSARPAPLRLVPVVPVALAVLLAGVGIGALAGFSAARHHRPGTGTLTAGSPLASYGGGPPVLILGGYGSVWPGGQVHPIPGPFDETRFSYRGLGRGGTPLPYGSSDTVKPLAVLDRMLATQVASLAGPARRPVALVAESEGALIVETYLHATPAAPVATVVLASPLLTSGQVSYPAAGGDGWGAAGAGGMASIGGAFQGAAPIDLSPDNAFLRSVVSEGPVLRHLVACPVAGVRQTALLALADAVGVPPHLRAALSTVVVATFHGGMLERPSVDRTIGRLLSDGTSHPSRLLAAAATAVSWAASSWQVPPLPAGDFPGAALRPGRTCRATDDRLAAVVWGRGTGPVQAAADPASTG